MRCIALPAGLAAGVAIARAPVAAAAPDPVTSYDVGLTPASGYGGWSHAYTGTTTPSGRFLGPSNCSSPPCELVDERGGRGTLNDGVVPTSIAEDQLLIAGIDSAGSPVSPTITLHLAGPTRVQHIRLSGGAVAFNFLPGLLTGAAVTIASATAAVTSAPAGDPGPLGTPTDNVLDLTASPVAGVETDTVTLSDSTADPIGLGQFSVGEIAVDGMPAPVTAASLCGLLRADVTGSARYQAAPAKRRADADRVVADACREANDVIAKGTKATKKARLLADFTATIASLRMQGWLTAGQAAAIAAQADRL